MERKLTGVATVIMANGMGCDNDREFAEHRASVDARTRRVPFR